MGRYLDVASVKGVRQVLHVPEALPGTCLGEVFLENVRWLGEHGLVYEGCVRNGELGDLYEMARSCPGTIIVLDHMGIVDPDIIPGKSHGGGSGLPEGLDREHQAAGLPSQRGLQGLRLKPGGGVDG